MGNRLLYQPYAARRGCEIFARGKRGGWGVECSGSALIWCRHAALWVRHPGLTGEDARRSTSKLSLRAVENLGVPRHLDCFQLAFVRLRGIIFEVRKRDHIFVQIGETNRERVDLGIGFRE